MSLMPHPAPRKRNHAPSKRPEFVTANVVFDNFANGLFDPPPPLLGWDPELKIRYPKDRSKPYRSIKWACRYRSTYHFASSKTTRTVGCESHNEFRMAYFLEVHPMITGFIEQPFQISWKDPEGNYHKHIPDFLAKFSVGNLLIEVKPDNALNDEALIARTKQLVQALSAQSEYKYVLITQSQLEGIPLENAKAIRLFPNLKLDTFELESFRMAFESSRTRLNLTALNRIKAISKIEDMEEKLHAMIRNGYLRFDMDRQFDTNTELAWVKGKLA